MKVKVINRSEASVTRERAEDVRQVHRNLDPVLHPFDKAKEYTRAVNAAKLERVFAKPFVAALEHAEAVYSLARNPQRLNCALAGCGDGVIQLWDIPERKCVPHRRGACVLPACALRRPSKYGLPHLCADKVERISANARRLPCEPRPR